MPKKLVVVAAHGDGEPPKTLDAGYVEKIKHYFGNLDKSPFNMIMGDTFVLGNTLGIIAYPKNRNTYGMKFKCCIGMLGIYA